MKMKKKEEKKKWKNIETNNNGKYQCKSQNKYAAV